ncbi:MAG TPA: glycosyltransferase [Thermodesulfobacteriota bacterium]
MRIALFLTNFPMLSETFILNQITGLINLGINFDIYASTNPHEEKVHRQVEEYNLLERVSYSDSITPVYKRLTKGVKIVLKNFCKSPLAYSEAMKSKSLRDIFYVNDFTLNKSRKSYDLIHAHYGSNGRIAAILKKSGVFKGKLITTFHGYDFSKLINERGIQTYKDLFRVGDLFTANTNFTKERLIELGCSKARVVKLPVGIEIKLFNYRERYLGEVDIVKLLTVGRMVEKKGLEYAIKAVARVAQKYPNIEYNIVGDGLLRQRLENLIKELGISDKVNLLGWKTQEELRKLFQDAHIFILSSVKSTDGDMEGQGLVLQEAQAVGIPVLSTLHNGIPEGVIDGKSGFLVPERDVDALTDRLQYLVEHRELWPEMGRCGRKLVEEKYDIKMLNSKLVRIYDALLTENTALLEELRELQ